MALNCKEGDLAIVVSTHMPFLKLEGRIVKCKKFFINHAKLPAWELEEKIMTSLDYVYAIADCALKPIRDQPGQDQSLSWKDVPSEVVA